MEDRSQALVTSEVKRGNVRDVACSRMIAWRPCWDPSGVGAMNQALLDYSTVEGVRPLETRNEEEDIDMTLVTCSPCEGSEDPRSPHHTTPEHYETLRSKSV